MWQIRLAVQFNGIVVFDPGVVEATLGPLRVGTNLFERFTSSDAGERALSAGLFVPILAIDDAEYDVWLRFDSEPSLLPDEHVLFDNGVLALETLDTLVVADLEAIRRWKDHRRGDLLTFTRGRYAVNVRGFAAPDGSTFGYELVLKEVAQLPQVTGKTEALARVAPRARYRRSAASW